MSSPRSSKPSKTKRGKSRVVDKWKSKSWYEVVAPTYIIEKSLGETPASEPELLYGRVIEMAKLGVSKDLYYDINLKISFKITKVEGNVCKTEFVGHEIAKEQIRSQIRRNRSKIEAILNVTTKDKGRLRISSIIITPIRCGTSAKKIVRTKIETIIKEAAKGQEFKEFVQNMVNGTLSAAIKEEVKKIYPVVMVDVRKSKVLTLPEGMEVSVES